MHVSRGGQLTPYGDPHGVLAETKAGLDQVVRERAYLLWEQAGRPDDRADDFWHEAQDQRFCERAYALWEREGCPEGKADEYWYRTRAFEETYPSSVTKIEELAPPRVRELIRGRVRQRVCGLGLSERGHTP